MKLKIFETFSGIGAQHKAFKKINKDFDIVATSEWDINAIISYDCIHNGSVSCERKMDNLLSKYNINNINDLENYLNKFTFSKNGKDPLTIKQSLSLSLLKKDLRSLT